MGEISGVCCESQECITVTYWEPLVERLYLYWMHVLTPEFTCWPTVPKITRRCIFMYISWINDFWLLVLDFLVFLLVVSSIRPSSTGVSSIDIAVIKDGDVSTCFSTDAADRAPFVALDYSPMFPLVTSIEIKSRSDIGKLVIDNCEIFKIKIFLKLLSGKH